MKHELFFFMMMCFVGSVYAQAEHWKEIEESADTLMAHEDAAGALKLYSEVIDSTKLKDPQTYPVLYKRALCFYSLGEFDNALKDVDRFSLQFPEFEQAKLLRAILYREQGKPEEQVKALSDILKNDSQNADLLKWRASAFLETGKNKEAREDLLVARKIKNDPEIALYTGLSYYYDNEPDSAITYFDKSIVLDKTFVTPYLYAGSLCLDQEAYDLALIYLNKAQLLEPGNFTIQFYKGIAYVEKNNLKDGCRCLKKAFDNGMDDAGDYLKEYCYGVEE